MHFTKLRFKKACISKYLSLKPERLGFEMSLPMLKSLSTAALMGKEVLYYTNSFFSTALAKELSSILFAGTADRSLSIRIAAASFFGSDWLNKEPNNSSVLTDLTSLSLSPLRLLAPVKHSTIAPVEHVPQSGA